MKRAVLLMLGLVAATIAHEGHSSDDDHSTEMHGHDHSETQYSSVASPTDSVVTVTFMSQTYTIPVFNPTNALTYGAPDPPLSTSKTEHSRRHSSSHSSSPTPTPSASSSNSASSQVAETSTTPSTTITSGSSTSVSAPAQQSTAAAHVIYPEIVGALAGCAAAGWALV